MAGFDVRNVANLGSGTKALVTVIPKLSST
jgi:hypothetical protein